jgi:hypothetical protein
MSVRRESGTARQADAFMISSTPRISEGEHRRPDHGNGGAAGLDRCEVRLSALGGAFRRISDGSTGLDRSEIRLPALAEAVA